MDSNTALVVAMSAFMLLLIARVPIAWVMALAGSIGLLCITSPNILGNVLATSPFSATAKFMLALIPMYLLLGLFALHSKIPERIFDLVRVKGRRVTGNLGLATLAACAGFSAVSGSSAAMAAVMGKLTVKDMQRHGYSAAFASGIVAGAGTLGVLIPPSLLMVLYAIMAEVSVGRMLLSGVIPGILTAICYWIYIYGHARAVGLKGEAFQPALAGASLGNGSPAGVVAQRMRDEPVAVGTDSGRRAPAGNEVIDQTLLYVGLWRALAEISLIFVIVVGGIYTGIFTATESGAVGALVALLVMISETRAAGGIRRVFEALKESLVDACATTSMVFAVLIGAMIFSYFLVRTGTPRRFVELMAGLDLHPMVVIALILLALVPLGMFLDSMGMLVVAVPLIAPVAVELGVNEIWFGLLVVKMIEIGMSTPPVGINNFITAAASGVKAEETFKGTAPFVVIDFLLTVLIFFVPVIAIWLPATMFGG